MKERWRGGWGTYIEGMHCEVYIDPMPLVLDLMLDYICAFWIDNKSTIVARCS